MPHFPERLSDVLGGNAGREVASGRRPVPARVVRAVDHGIAVAGTAEREIWEDELSSVTTVGALDRMVAERLNGR